MLPTVTMTVVRLRDTVTMMTDDGEAEGHGDHENDIVGTCGFHRLEDMLLRSLRGAHEDITGAASPVSMKSDTFGRGEMLTQFFNTKQVSKPRWREKEREKRKRERTPPPGTPVHLGGDGVKGPRTNSPRTSEARDPRGKARRRGGGWTLCGLRPWIPRPGVLGAQDGAASGPQTLPQRRALKDKGAAQGFLGA